jgi:hypothetical protein
MNVTLLPEEWQKLQDKLRDLTIRCDLQMTNNIHQARHIQDLERANEKVLSEHSLTKDQILVILKQVMEKWK